MDGTLYCGMPIARIPVCVLCFPSLLLLAFALVQGEIAVTDPKPVASLDELASVIAGNNSVSVSDIDITTLPREDPR